MSYQVEQDVQVPMRDGVRLGADVWIPEGPPAPALLVRTPYSKRLIHSSISSLMMADTFALVDAGYAVVWQDCRGMYRSAGAFAPHEDDAHDGADTVAWLRRQPWCDGTVGMYGQSYLGMTQFATAAQTPEGLRAIAPCVTSSDCYEAPWFSTGGAVSWHALWSWSVEQATLRPRIAGAAATGNEEVATEESAAALRGLLADPASHLSALPIGRDALLDEHAPWVGRFLGHPARDQFWRKLAPIERAQRVTTPALHVGGWFDLFVGSTTRTFTTLRRTAATEAAREGQRLVIGPWCHDRMVSGAYLDRQFGPHAEGAAADLTGMHIRFFDRWLRGEATDPLNGTDRVRIFVMGVDRWRDEPDWPLPNTTYTDYFLGSQGTANTASGDGALTTAPSQRPRADTYLYDPARPVPSLGGRLMLPVQLNAVGPVDQRPVETREDVLCYSTPPLETPLEVTGHVSLVLYVSSTAKDTDFTGKLVDVMPDGRAIYLTDGILRTRYRKALAAPEPMEPHEVHEVTLDLLVTSNVFLPGHRMRLEVSSSNFPRYDRNTNTGGVIAHESAEQAITAVNRVLHGPEHPSRLVLPVIHSPAARWPYAYSPRTESDL